ncbi:MAG: hypothetical protein U0350_00955 [Caldilineaceae bacterium]
MDDSSLLQRVLENAFVLADIWRLQGRWRNAHTLVQGLYPVALAQGDEAMAQVCLLDGRILIDEAMFGGQETLTASEEVLDRAFVHAQTTQNAALLGSFWDAKGFIQHAIYLGSNGSKEPEQELAYFERGLALRRTVADQRGIAESLFHVGLVYGVIRHDHTNALPYFEESYRLAQTIGDDVMASYAIRHIGFAHHAAGEGAAARAAMAESLKLREAAGFLPGAAMALHTMAYAETEYGDKTQAIPYLERAKSIFEALGVAKYTAWMAAEIEQFRQMERKRENL